MKKVLLSLLAVVTATVGSAQVIFNVLDPASIEGDYSFEAASWGETPDLTLPANRVQGLVEIVDDGTAGDSLGCQALSNSLDVAGKVAMVYRGDCEFGDKALNADVAGAIAVIIVNNEPGEPIPMAAGTNGNNVDVPVIMIGQSTGAMIRAELDAGNPVEVFIGNKLNLFDYDFGIYNKDIVHTGKTSIPSLLAQNGSEFSYVPAAWVFNYGAIDQTDGIFNVVVEFGGSEVYNESATALSIDSGDSLYVSLPEFSMTTYDPGLYTITYTTSLAGNTDEYPGDNEVVTSFHINDNQKYANARVDATGDLIAGDGLRAQDAASFAACIVFSDANASRLAVDGIDFAISKSGDESIAGEYVYTSVWQWGPFDDLDDPAFGSAEITFVGDGEYSFDNGEVGGEYVSTTLRNADGDFILLEDNTRYIFCAESDNADVYFSFDSNTNYYRNIDFINRQPYMLIKTTDFGLGFTDYYGTPAIAAKFIDPATVGLAHQDDLVEVTPFPNPAKNVITIPLQNLEGAATLQVIDVAGRTVLTENVTLNASQTLSVDLSSLTNGTYTFNMNFEDGKASTFRVVVNK